MNIVTAAGKWKWYAPFGIAGVLTVLIYCLSAGTGFFEINSPRAEDSYYNLLVRGFRAGQLNVKRDVPPELERMSNPYAPSANAACAWDTRSLSYEMSYYRGKLYLYFGVTPALVLFWPYAALTGSYCTHRCAVITFDAVGILTATWLIYSIWRRYFFKTNVWNAAIGVLALGLAPCFMDQLSTCDVHEVPRSSGFAFTMLSLAAIWNALHQPSRQLLWLALASLAYGLAVGSLASLLPGIVIVLIPVIPSLRSPPAEVPVRRKICLLTAAAVPAMMIGLGLAAYNFLRFDNPFDFGWKYQLTDIPNPSAQPFGLHYLWFNFKFYFLEPLHWNHSFPFISTHILSPEPLHYYGVGNPYGGILVNYPLVWFALAAGLPWFKRPAADTTALRLYLWALLLLFVICTLTLCGFFCGSSSYLLDFLPGLMLLAIIGGCALENAAGEHTSWRRVVRWSWRLLLIGSITISTLVGFKTHAYANFVAANSLLNGGRTSEAVEHFEKSIQFDPNRCIYYIGFGNAYARAGNLAAAIAEYQQAVGREAGNVEANYDLSLALIDSGRVDEATRYFQTVTELNGKFLNTQNPVTQNNIAWRLATNPESAKRNGKMAVALAESACRQTDFKVTAMIGTLAAAYAEAGRFEDAILTAQKACALASSTGEPELLKKNQQLLSLYLKHTAYQEDSASPR